MKSSLFGALALLASIAGPLQAEFVCVGGPSSISVYQVREGGTLVAVGSPYPVAGGARSVGVDHAGRVVYKLSGNVTGSVKALNIDEKGRLTPVAGSPFATDSQPVAGFPFPVATGQLTVDLSGRFLYAANPANNTISAYRISEKGALTPVAGSPFTVPGGLSSGSGIVSSIAVSP
jgi:6-phosphogluconolactonase (cycloisomerase 2 family)